MSAVNFHEREVRKFSSVAEQWWDPHGVFRPLHLLNPSRMIFINKFSPVNGKSVLDVGCGGGILSEALARENANVIGLDLSEESLNIARLHLMESQLNVEYINSTVEDYAENCENHFDIITCMEVLEHVPDPVSVIHACNELLKPGGSLYISTLNRTVKSWVFGIVGAEYVLNLLPRGTHQHKDFIRPSELYRWSASCGIKLKDITGLHYNPYTQTFRLGPGISVNYLAHCQKP